MHCGLSLKSEASAQIPFSDISGQKVPSRMRSLHRCQLLVVAAWILFLTGCGSPSDPQPSFSTNLAATQHPLVAQYKVSVSTAAQVTVEFGTTTAYGRSTATQSINAGGDAPILVAGMRPATAYHMRARIDFASGATMYDSDHTFTTKTLPNATFPQVKVTQTSGFAAQGVDVTSSTGPQVTAAVFDNDGSLIWYYYDPKMPPLTFPLKFLPNGEFIAQYYQNLREVDLSGKIIREETIDKVNSELKSAGYSIHAVEFHHDMLSLDNGHWILLVDLQKDYQDLPGYPGTTHVVGDAIIDLDPNGHLVWAWNTFDHLDVNRHPYMFPDWTHSNALVYTADGNLLLSMRHQSWIIKINYANGAGNGDILWHLGPEGDFALAQNERGTVVLQPARSHHLAKPGNEDHARAIRQRQHSARRIRSVMRTEQGLLQPRLGDGPGRVGHDRQRLVAIPARLVFDVGRQHRAAAQWRYRNRFHQPQRRAVFRA